MIEVIGRYLEVDGIATYYEDCGQGPALLCLHAACQDTLFFRHLQQGLGDRYRIVVPDLPGHGKSLLREDWTPLRTVEERAAWTWAFVRHLDLPRAAVLGASYNAPLALLLGVEHPDAFAALIAVEGGVVGGPPFPDVIRDMLFYANQPIVETWCRTLIGDRASPARRDEVVHQILRTTPRVASADLTEAAERFPRRAPTPWFVRSGTADLGDLLGEIRIPTLLVKGGASWLTPAPGMAATTARIPGARLVVQEGVGHYPSLEDPDEFNRIVGEFLDGLARW